MKAFTLRMLCLFTMLALTTGWAALAEATPTHISGEYTYIILEDGTAQIVDWQGRERSLRVPNRLNGRAVTSISECAFYRSDTLASVTLPGSILEIGENAFEGCAALEQVSLSEGLARIGDYAFKDCEGLTAIALPDSVRQVGCNPFAGCDNLCEIRVSPLAAELRVMGGVLFTASDHRLVCYPMGLQAVRYDVPEGVGVIGARAFDGALCLETVTLPGSVTAIGENAFAGCSGRMELCLPVKVAPARADDAGLTLRLEGIGKAMSCVFPAGVAVNAT